MDSLSNQFGLASIGATCFGLFLFRYRHPVCLRNFYLVYTWALCVLGPLLFGYPGESTVPWSVHFVWLAICYIAFWWVGSRQRDRTSSTRPIVSAVSPWARCLDDLVTGAVLLLIGLQCLVILTNIRRFGLSGFFSGALLVEQIQSYGQADAGGAAYQVVTFVLTALTNALLFFFVTRAYVAGSGASEESDGEGAYVARLKTRALRLCFASLVMVPLIQFSRSGLVYGAIAYLAARSFLRGRNFSLPMVTVVSAAIAFFVVVGLAREARLGGSAGLTGLFASEVSPWMAYRDIQENIEYLGYQNGRTILAPMLLKFAPRGLFPDKPQNSGGYYMDMMYPERFDAGYALAPTYLGDLFLNFGRTGVFIGTAILGLFSGLADSLGRRAMEKYLGLYLVCLLWYVSILRDALSNSLFGFASSAVLLFVVSALATALYSLDARSADAVGRPRGR